MNTESSLPSPRSVIATLRFGLLFSLCFWLVLFGLVTGCVTMYSDPLGYFLTFTVHGTWLHGDVRGSFRKCGVFVPPSPNHIQSAASSYRLSTEQRAVINGAFVALCQQREWDLHTISVRTNHVHVVITAMELKPERVMADLKAKATRELRKVGLFPTDKTLWTERGSTIYLFTQTSFDNACRYVHEGQANSAET